MVYEVMGVKVGGGYTVKSVLQSQHEVLYLPDVQELSSQTVKKKAGFKGQALALGGLTSVDAEVKTEL